MSIWKMEKKSYNLFVFIFLRLIILLLLHFSISSNIQRSHFSYTHAIDNFPLNYYYYYDFCVYLLVVFDQSLASFLLMFLFYHSLFSNWLVKRKCQVGIKIFIEFSFASDCILSYHLVISSINLIQMHWCYNYVFSFDSIYTFDSLCSRVIRLCLFVCFFSFIYILTIWFNSIFRVNWIPISKIICLLQSK